MTEIETAKVWLAKDVARSQPTISSSLFSGKELVAAMGETWGDGVVLDVVLNLERMHVLLRTNHVGPDGDYFNIHPQFFDSIHPNRMNRLFVRKLNTLLSGWCFVFGEKKTYKQTCEARKCRYYLAHEKKCVKGKFFIK